MITSEGLGERALTSSRELQMRFMSLSLLVRWKKVRSRVLVCRGVRLLTANSLLDMSRGKQKCDKARIITKVVPGATHVIPLH